MHFDGEIVVVGGLGGFDGVEGDRDVDVDGIVLSGLLEGLVKLLLLLTYWLMLIETEMDMMKVVVVEEEAILLHCWLLFLVRLEVDCLVVSLMSLETFHCNH